MKGKLWVLILALIVVVIAALSYQPEYLERDNNLGKFGITVELETESGKMIKLVPSSPLQSILPQLTYCKYNGEKVTTLHYKLLIKAEGVDGSIDIIGKSPSRVTATSTPIDEGAQEAMGDAAPYTKWYYFTTTSIPVDGQWHEAQHKIFSLSELCPGPLNHDVATSKVTITCCEVLYKYNGKTYTLGTPGSVSFTIKSYKGWG